MAKGRRRRGSPLTPDQEGKARVSAQDREDQADPGQAPDASDAMRRVGAVGAIHVAPWGRPHPGICSSSGTGGDGSDAAVGGAGGQAARGASRGCTLEHVAEKVGHDEGHRKDAQVEGPEAIPVGAPAHPEALMQDVLRKVRDERKGHAKLQGVRQLLRCCGGRDSHESCESIRKAPMGISIRRLGASLRDALAADASFFFAF